MIRFVLIYFLAFTGTFVVAQDIQVVDSENKQGLEGVMVLSLQNNHIEFTDENGYFSLNKFNNTTSLRLQSEGFKELIVQTENLVEEGTVYLESWSIVSDELTISASRWESEAVNSSSLATVTAKEVILQNPQTAADLLQVSNRVYIQKSQLGGGSPMIRGYSTNRLLYSVDGVRMNTAIFRGGNIQNVISLDPFSIEHTQVLMGPGSVLYGSDAIGAVMKFRTLKPRLSYDKIKTTGNVVTRISSANQERSFHLDYNIGSKKLAYTGSFSFFKYGDLQMGSNGPDEYLKPYTVERIDGTDVIKTNENPRIQDPTAFEQMNIMQKLRYKINSNWDLTYAFHLSETSSYGRYDRHLRVRDGLPRYGQWDYGPQKWNMNHLKLRHDRPTILYDSWQLDVAYQQFEESRISRDFNDPIRNTQIEEVGAISGNVDFKKSIASNNQLYYGLEYVQNNVISTALDEDITNGSTIEAAPRYPNSIWSSYGLYVSDTWLVNKNIEIGTGIRYNIVQIDAQFNQELFPLPYDEARNTNDALTGSVGILYTMNPSWKIRSNVSTAFRAPNVDDMGKVFDSEPGSVVVPNPDLSPEYAYNVDVGFNGMIGDRVTIDGSFFYIYLDNALVRRNFTLNGQDSINYLNELSQVQAIQNAAFAYTYGTSWHTDINVYEGFKLFGTLNWLRGYEETDDGTLSPSRHVPPLFGRVGAAYENERIKVEFYNVFNGEKSPDQMAISEQNKPEIYLANSNGDLYSPAWMTWNIKASTRINKHFTAQVGIENLTDLRYRSYSSGIVAPGRNFIFSVRAGF